MSEYSSSYNIVCTLRNRVTGKISGLQLMLREHTRHTRSGRKRENHPEDTCSSSPRDSMDIVITSESTCNVLVVFLLLLHSNVPNEAALENNGLSFVLFPKWKG